MDTNVERVFERHIFYTKNGKNNFIIYALKDISCNKYAIILSNYLYNDFELNFIETEHLINELILEELNLPYLDWFSNISLAIQNHFDNFFD